MRRIGNSLGVTIRADEAMRQGLSEGDEVVLEIERKVTPKELFGKFRFSKSSQELKDESREAWG